MTEKSIRRAQRWGFEKLATVGVFVFSSLIIGYISVIDAHSIWARGEHFRLRRFFTAQAEAMLNGHLWVSRIDMGKECFYAADKCYGYFGITPSVLRMPFMWLAPGQGMTDVFVIVGLLIGIAGSLVLVNAIVRALGVTLDSTWNRIAYVSALLIAGPGNIWIQLSLPTGYEEAIVWASTFATWGMVALVSWWTSGRLSWLAWATLAFVAGANARPSAIPIAAAAGVTVLVYVVMTWRTTRAWKAGAWAIALAAAPLVTACWVWYAKLGTLLPRLAVNESVMTSPNWARIMKLNGGRDSWIGFVPTNLVQYLRPDNLRWANGQLEGVRPGVDKVLILPPLHGQGIFVTHMGSVTSLVPAILLLLAILVWRTPRFASTLTAPNTLPRIATWGIVLSAWAALALLAINVGVQNRYMGDLTPAIAVTAAVAVGSLLVSDRIPQKLRRTLIIAIAVLAVAGIGVEVLHQFWQIAQRHLGPAVRIPIGG